MSKVLDGLSRVWEKSPSSVLLNVQQSAERSEFENQFSLNVPVVLCKLTLRASSTTVNKVNCYNEPFFPGYSSEFGGICFSPLVHLIGLQWNAWLFKQRFCQISSNWTKNVKNSVQRMEIRNRMEIPDWIHINSVILLQKKKRFIEHNSRLCLYPQFKGVKAQRTLSNGQRRVLHFGHFILLSRISALLFQQRRSLSALICKRSCDSRKRLLRDQWTCPEGLRLSSMQISHDSKKWTLIKTSEKSLLITSLKSGC